jgi:hypothetical protein
MNYEQGNDCHFSVLRSSFRVQLFARCGLEACHREDCLPNDRRGGLEAVGCWIGLDLAFGHNGGGATGFVFFVDLAIDDLHALEIFLDDFFTREFDALFRFSACPLANSVDQVFFHQNANLFGQIGTGRQFLYPLADDLSFRHVALTFADEVLVR